jgi:hypothetical protein
MINMETTTLDEFYEEICAAIVKTLDENPDAPIADVTREVAMGMLLGEDKETADEIRRRLEI